MNSAGEKTTTTTQIETSTTKAPAHSSPRYLCQRIRKLFAAKGWPLRKVTGRYAPFVGNTQCANEGFEVHKIGCSKSIAISYVGGRDNGRYIDVPKEARCAREAEAWAYLRSLGYRVDEKGWIECDSYDECDR